MADSRHQFDPDQLWQAWRRALWDGNHDAAFDAAVALDSWLLGPPRGKEPLWTRAERKVFRDWCYDHLFF